MTERRHDAHFGSAGRSHFGSRSSRAFMMSIAWIVALLTGYWLMVDWQTVPVLMSEALAAIH